MTLKEQLLAKIQQNKLDRAKHQEQVEGLDRGLIYLQGQLDLVEQVLAAEAAKAKADADTLVNEAKAKVEALASSVKTEVQKLEGEASAELTKVENEVKNALDNSHCPPVPPEQEAGPATQSD